MYNKMIAKKIQKLRVSHTTKCFERIKRCCDSDSETISLAIGDTTLCIPHSHKEAIYTALNDLENNHYADVSGHINLKKVISNEILIQDKVFVNTKNIFICNGAKQCIYNVLLAIINEGDEIIIPSPSWPSYEEIVKLNGGIARFLETKPENNYLFSLKALEELITPKTKALIINNPNNPTGSIYPSEFLRAVLRIIREKNIFLISDEVYRSLVYFSTFTSISSLMKIEKVENKVIVINSISKSLSLAGWRIGYMQVPVVLIDSIKKIMSNTTSNTNTLIQLAVTNIIQDVEYKKSINEIMKKIRRLC